MGILDRFVPGADDPDDDANYRCIRCGAGFARDHYSCPKCGGQFVAPLLEDDVTE